MKKTMLVAMAVGVCLFAVGKEKPRCELTAAVTLAPYSEVTAKVMQLGKLINNPLMPSLLLGAAQQEIAKKFGAFDSNRPLRLMLYVEQPAFTGILKNTKKPESAAKYAKVAAVVAPAVKRDAYKAARQGLKELPDGTFERAPGDGDSSVRYVKYAADGASCAIAPTAAIAAQALADAKALPNDATSPIFRADLTPAGFAALSDVVMVVSSASDSVAKEGSERLAEAVKAFEANQSSQQLRLLNRFEKAFVTADLDEGGLTFAYSLTPKAGKARTYAALPAGALDAIPAGAPICFAGNQRVMAGFDSEREFRSTMELGAEVIAAAAEEVLKALEVPESNAFAKVAVAETVAFVKALPYPSDASWTAAWIGFDAKQHPVIEQIAEGDDVAGTRAASEKLTASIAAAAARQWPGKTFFTRTPSGAYRCDWNRLVDQCQAMQSAEDDDPFTPEDAAEVKKTIADVLGGPVSEISCVSEGPTRLRSRFAAPGVKIAAGKGASGEAALAAAVPEIGKNRPAAAFRFEFYSFLRDVLMPVLARTLDADEAKRVKTLSAGLAPAKPNSALVGAAWRTPDGVERGMIRVTANEVMNCGTLFNTFTAASLMEQDGTEE